MELCFAALNGFFGRYRRIRTPFYEEIKVGISDAGFVAFAERRGIGRASQKQD